MKKKSLKEQMAQMKKMGPSAAPKKEGGMNRFQKMAEKARKEMMEKRKKQSKSRSTGSRKPGSMY
jgi:hypothetical protein